MNNFENYRLSPHIGGKPINGGKINWGKIGSNISKGFNKVGSALNKGYKGFKESSFYQKGKDALKESNLGGIIGQTLADTTSGFTNLGLEILKHKALKGQDDFLMKSAPELYQQKKLLEQLEQESELAKLLKEQQKINKEESLKRKADELLSLAQKPKKMKLSDIKLLGDSQLENYVKYYGTEFLPEEEEEDIKISKQETSSEISPKPKTNKKVPLPVLPETPKTVAPTSGSTVKMWKSGQPAQTDQFGYKASLIGYGKNKNCKGRNVLSGGFSCYRTIKSF